MSFYRDFNEKQAFEQWNSRPRPQFKTLHAEPLSRAGGAEVSGVDLSSELSPDQWQEVQAALAEHMVLVFRDQTLDTAQHKAFGQRWGRLHCHVSAAKRAPGGDPEVLAWKTGKDSRFTAGEAWHNDVSCEASPIAASILRLTRAPQLGGETAFVNTHLVHQSLSTPFQQFIAHLTAEHSGHEGWTNGYGDEPAPGQAFARHVHPVVLRHPRTGRQHLFVNRGFTTHIQELTRAESQATLEVLYRHVESQLASQFRVQWQPGTVVIWDNWAVQHQAVWDYYPHERWGERVSAVAGLEPQPA